MSSRPWRKRAAFTAVTLGGVLLFAAIGYALSPDVRVGWVRVLARAGADESLAGMADDEDKDVRAAAAESLVARGTLAVPTLVRRLARPNPVERETACRVLGRIGPTARDAMPALKALLHEDPDQPVRSQAVLALALVGRGDPLVVSELTRLLKAPGADDREAAAFACRVIGADAKRAIPALAAALSDHDPEVREEVVKALNAITGELGDEDADLRDAGRAAAAKAMAEMLAGGRPPAP